MARDPRRSRWILCEELLYVLHHAREAAVGERPIALVAIAERSRSFTQPGMVSEPRDPERAMRALRAHAEALVALDLLEYGPVRDTVWISEKGEQLLSAGPFARRRAEALGLDAGPLFPETLYRDAA